MQYFENLTECERVVMKVVWDAGHDISLVQIMDELTGRYGKAWKRQTVSTFLLHLIQKGYLTSYRKGRVFYYHQEVDFDAYKEFITADFIRFWFDDSADGLRAVMEKIGCWAD